jgi:hypothetical protein
MMEETTRQAAQKQIDEVEDTLYDLSYDDMDSFMRSCGVILPKEAGDLSPSVSSLLFT